MMRPVRDPASLRRQRGAALLVAIAAVGLLTAIAVELTAGVQDDLRLAEAFRDEFRARWAVRAPVALAISAIQNDESPFTGFTSEWARLGETLRLDGLEVRFRVRDESSKLNLNALGSAQPAVREGVARAAKAVFAEKEIPEALVDSLADWIDPDEEERLIGDEGAYYAGLPYPVKNAPLDSLAELRLVRGFDAKALRALGFPRVLGGPDTVLHDQFTVFSDQKVNVNTADPFLIRNLVEGLPERFLDHLAEVRRERPIEKLLDLKQLEGMDDKLYNRLAPMISVDSKYFSVVAEVLVGRIRKRLTAVLKKEEDRVAIVYWRLF